MGSGVDDVVPADGLEGSTDHVAVVELEKVGDGGLLSALLPLSSAADVRSASVAEAVSKITWLMISLAEETAALAISLAEESATLTRGGSLKDAVAEADEVVDGKGERGVGWRPCFAC